MGEPLSVGLDNLQGKEGATKKRKRVGRGTGSGTGKTAGRGVKGQNSRSGGGTRRGFEGGQTPLQRRIPKYGFTPPFRKEYQVVNLSALEEKFESGAEVTPQTLLEAGLIKSTRALVKILGDGELKKELKVKAHKFSKSATQKINQAGGSVEEIKLGSG